MDVERPLREFVSSNREMTAMSTVQGNLGAMAKDVEKAQSKTDKLKGKGERAEAGKVANANSDLDDAQTRWGVAGSIHLRELASSRRDALDTSARCLDTIPDSRGGPGGEESHHGRAVSECAVERGDHG